MDEFELIRRYFTWPTSLAADGVVLSVGDDAALLSLPNGQQLVVTTDTLVSGRHFFADADAFNLGQKALAVNVSDLAAMAATPLAFTLSLTLPELDEPWLQAFSDGLRMMAQQHDMALVGGDTTRGPLAISITAMGSVPPAQALRRSTAQPGDYLVVSGCLGDAGLGLDLMSGQSPALKLSTEAQAAVLTRLHTPTPRVTLGLALRGKAHAAMDISDGLLQDLHHMLKASGGLGACLTLDDLPLSAAAQQLLPESAEYVLNMALAAGDDYELLFAMPEATVNQLATLSQQLSLPLTIIGRITQQPAINLQWQGDAWPYPLPLGYRHF